MSWLTMERSPINRMVEDPFSLFSIFMIFVLSSVITGVITIPLLDHFVFNPEGESITTAAFTREDLFYTPGGVFILVLVSNIALLSILYIRVIRMGGRTFDEIGVKFNNLKEHLPAGLVYGILILFIMMIISIFYQLLDLEAVQRFAVPRNGIELVMLLAVGAVLAPAGEEIFFRGYIISALSSRYSRPFVYVFSAVLFALLHFDLANLPPLILFGMFQAYVFEKYKNVMPCIVVHGLNNFVAIMLLYVTG